MREEIALLGLPSTLQSGSFLLMLYSGKTLLWQQELSVEMGSFLKEDIPLNQKMSDLRSDDDPQKVEEAIAIHAIYNTFHRRPFDEKLSLHLPVTGGAFPPGTEIEGGIATPTAPVPCRYILGSILPLPWERRYPQGARVLLSLQAHESLPAIRWLSNMARAYTASFSTWIESISRRGARSMPIPTLASWE